MKDINEVEPHTIKAGTILHPPASQFCIRQCQAQNCVWLEDRNVNITSQFVTIFKVFEDFRFISQLKEEIDKVPPDVSNPAYCMSEVQI